MFMGPWDQGGPWSPTGIEGVHRFLRRVWTVALDPHGREASDSGALPDGQDLAAAERALRVGAHRALKGVTEDHEGFRWNTMVAKLMELTNLLMRYRGTDAAGTPGWDEAVRLLLLMLAPVAPHIAEELWSRRLAAAGEPWRSIHAETWPAFDPDARRRRRDRAAGPGQRQAARPGADAGRTGTRRGRARSSSRDRRSRRTSTATRWSRSSTSTAGSSTSSSGERPAD